MDNMELYNKVREVPKEAQNPFSNGRFNGTDINPMWRIKTLTENFGACGVGWYYEIDDYWWQEVDNKNANVPNEVIANVIIKLYIKQGDEWSKPIIGVGGSKSASNERKGLYANDEAFKMAQTDALSVACKNLGIGADIYWDKDNDKYIDHKKEEYNKEPSNSKASTAKPTPRAPQNDASMLDKDVKYWQDKISEYADAHGMTTTEICNDYHVGVHSSAQRLKAVYDDLTSASTADSKGEHMADDFAALDEKLPF